MSKENSKFEDTRVVSLSQLWPWWRYGHGQTFDLVFPNKTVVPASFKLALFNVETPPGKAISVAGQSIPDQYFTEDEPLLPWCIGFQKLVIPANTKVTCIILEPRDEERYNPECCYQGKHIAYRCGMFGLKNTD